MYITKQHDANGCVLTCVCTAPLGRHYRNLYFLYRYEQINNKNEIFKCYWLIHITHRHSSKYQSKIIYCWPLSSRNLLIYHNQFVHTEILFVTRAASATMLQYIYIMLSHFFLWIKNNLQKNIRLLNVTTISEYGRWGFRDWNASGPITNTQCILID